MSGLIYEIWRTRTTHRHNHVGQTFSQSVQGLRSSDSPKLSSSVNLLCRHKQCANGAVRTRSEFRNWFAARRAYVSRLISPSFYVIWSCERDISSSSLWSCIWSSLYIVWGHVESRVHFVMKASHLSSYVKGSLRFPKMVVGTLGNVWDSYSDNL